MSGATIRTLTDAEAVRLGFLGSLCGIVKCENRARWMGTMTGRAVPYCDVHAGAFCRVNGFPEPPELLLEVAVGDRRA
jgi:hypothetical protein